MPNLLKKYTYQLLKCFPTLRKWTRKVFKLLRTCHYKIVTGSITTEPNYILFHSYKGGSYSCSPKAIYQYLLANDDYQEYHFIWAFKNPEEYQSLTANRNTEVIGYLTNDYYKAMARAKYWIINYHLANFIMPKKEQVYLQCWHGTPLKRLGHDLISSDNSMNTLTELYARYDCDARRFTYFLSPSTFMTEKIISAWNLERYNKTDCILEEGYPRNDFLYRYTDADTAAIRLRLNLPSGKKVLLYAPTWRDNQHASGIGYTYKLQIDLNKLQKALQDEYIILIRAHYLVTNQLNLANYLGFAYDVSMIDDINELYIIADMLITDYSSVFFDYANLRRPIIFFMYDLEQYRDCIRGFYLDLDELPGRIVTKEDELIAAVIASDNFQLNKRYLAFNQKYNYLDDGFAAARVVDKMFNKVIRERVN